MKITDAFLGEHAVFYAQFTFLEETLPQTENLALIKAYGTMLGTALASHAQLEEELLFQKLESQIGLGGPLVVMRAEHNQIEQSLETLPAVQDLAQAQALLQKVITVARNHFTKEEQILYRIALQTLSTETLSKLGSQWAECRAITLE